MRLQDSTWVYAYAYFAYLICCTIVSVIETHLLLLSYLFWKLLSDC